MNVAVHEKRLASAPVHVQSAVYDHPCAIVTSGAVSCEDHIVAVTVTLPPVASLAIGSPLTVGGLMSAVASKSPF